MTLDHVLRRKEVEELLHVHRRTVDYYSEKGYLVRVYMRRSEMHRRAKLEGDIRRRRTRRARKRVRGG